jgi:hypothetical protein
MRALDAQTAAQEKREQSPATPAVETTPPTAASSADQGIFSSADRRSFETLAGRLAGREGVAVSALDKGSTVQRLGSLRSGVAWSTAKAPVAMAAIAAGVANDADLTQAITASDNAAAERLWSALGAGQKAADATTAQLRDAGDERTRVPAQKLRSGYTVFGQTAWALTDQVRFTAGMACSSAGARVLKLMGSVVAGQRWGLGDTGHTAQFKGGWGPGIAPGASDGWLDRQLGIVTIGGRPLAVTIATDAADHAAGTRTLTTLARWVTSHANTASLPKGRRC